MIILFLSCAELSQCRYAYFRASTEGRIWGFDGNHSSTGSFQTSQGKEGAERKPCQAAQGSGCLRASSTHTLRLLVLQSLDVLAQLFLSPSSLLEPLLQASDWDESIAPSAGNETPAQHRRCSRGVGCCRLKPEL